MNIEKCSDCCSYSSDNCYIIRKYHLVMLVYSITLSFSWVVFGIFAFLGAASVAAGTSSRPRLGGSQSKGSYVGFYENKGPLI